MEKQHRKKKLLTSHLQKSYNIKLCIKGQNTFQTYNTSIIILKIYTTVKHKIKCIYSKNCLLGNQKYYKYIQQTSKSMYKTKWQCM